MQQEMTVSRLLAQLEARLELHQGQEALHAEKEAFHREQRALHAAELQTVRERLAALRAAAEAADELMARRPATATIPLVQDLPAGRVSLSQLVAWLIASKGSEETFGGHSLAREVNQVCGSRLRRKADPRTVATTLRRMAQAGRLHQVREGRANHEGLYKRKE